MMANVKNQIQNEILRGDIYWVDLGLQNGSIQGGKHPCVITQNNIGNKFSTTVTIAPLSSQIWKCKLPTHVLLKQGVCVGLKKDSFILTEQIRTINKFELIEYIGHIEMTEAINTAIEISQGIQSNNKYIMIAKEKANSIRELDTFIEIWLSAGRDITIIADEVKKRTLRLKDFKNWCECNRLNSNEFYDEEYIKTGENKVRMVG